MTDDRWSSGTGLLALMGLPRVGPQTALAVARGQRPLDELPDTESLDERFDEAGRAIAALVGRDITVLGYFDAGFPARLRNAPGGPAVVYVRGDLAAFDGPAVAVVGTREPTSFGVTATRTLTEAAVRAGIAVISGLALGVDAIAHEAALDAGGRTVAVLGSGVDNVTPRQHQSLADRILASGGALLSEQPAGTQPSARTLVARNRLQAALADALLVGQTGLKGGTLHTVRFAAEQHKPIWCPVPHQPSDQSAGLLALLQEPASKLPDLLPAWKGHERLAARLGTEPLARPVTSDGVRAWVAALTAGSGGPATDAPPPSAEGQLGLSLDA